MDKLSDKEADFSSLTVERISESEHSQVEMQKYGRQTIIEEIITRIEENEREIIEEKLVGKGSLLVCIYLYLADVLRALCICIRYEVTTTTSSLSG